MIHLLYYFLFLLVILALLYVVHTYVFSFTLSSEEHSFLHLLWYCFNNNKGHSDDTIYMIQVTEKPITTFTHLKVSPCTDLEQCGRPGL